MSENKKKSEIIKIIFPVIHFLLTFLLERLALIPQDRSSVSFSLPMSNLFSDTFEQIMCYVLSKAMAGIIMFLIWFIIFKVIEKKVDKETVLVFSIILVLSTAITILVWPDVFTAGGDNFIPYSYAIRLMPEYWHSIYLSCLYTASIMVIPHAISINLLQMFAFVMAIAYLYDRIKKCETLKNVKWIRFILLAVFLFKDTFTVMTNPERAEYNVSFSIIFVAIILMDIIEKKKRPTYQVVLLLIYAAFLAVFRSEGIIVAVLGFVALMLIVYKPKFVRIVLLLGGMLVALIAFKLPPKFGEIKYYGSDYSIVNSFNPLHNIFLSDKANLTYEGVEEDLAAIEKITPVKYIEEFASEGYRRYNYSEGRIDINQSMADKNAAASYKKAYRNIVLHNIPIYAKTQLFMFLQATCAVPKEYSEVYSGEASGLEPFGEDIWEVGRNDYQIVPGKYRWQNLAIRNKVAAVFTIPRLKYVDILTKTRAYTAFLYAEMIIGIIIPIHAFISFLRKKKEYIGVGAIALIIDAYVAALSLMMPVGANMYFHMYIYCMFALIGAYLGLLLNSRKTRITKE